MLNTLNQWANELYATLELRDTGESYNHKRGRWEPMDESRWEEFAHRVEQIPTRFIRFIADETKTAEPEAPAAAPTAPAEPEETEAQKRGDEEPRPARTGGAKPPEDGLCRNCRQRRRLNRFKLCYPCWVEAEIIDREKGMGREWKPGDKHPEWCYCQGLGEHQERDGSARGFN